MKRVVCILLIAALAALSLAACGEQSATEPAAPQTEATDPASSAQSAGELDLKAFIKAFDTAPSLQETVLFADAGVTVVAKGIEYDPINGPIVLIGVTNDSDRDMTVTGDTVVVNGFMMNASFTVECSASKSAEGQLVLPYGKLAMSGISSIAKVELALLAAQADDAADPANAVTAALTTSSENSGSTVNDSGQTAYDGNNVRIVLKGVDERRMYSDGPALIVYMENAADKTVSIQTGDIKVNGYDFTSAMSTDILPGKKAVDIVTFFDMDMQEYGISEIDSVELSFKIIDEAAWDTIAETGMITVDLGSDDSTQSE